MTTSIPLIIRWLHLGPILDGEMGEGGRTNHVVWMSCFYVNVKNVFNGKESRIVVTRLVRPDNWEGRKEKGDL